MDSHPVLHLLGVKEDPPFHLFQTTAAAIANCPRYLSDLMQSDLQDDFLGLLTLRASCLMKVLKLLGKELFDPRQMSAEIFSFVQQLVKTAKPYVDRSEYLDLLCAALPLCSTTHFQWKLIGALAADHQTLETLTTSEEGHSILLKWALISSQDGVDTIVSNDWTQRLVTLVALCPDNHERSTTLVRWQKVESLKHILRTVLESGAETGPSESSNAECYKLRSNQTKIDRDVIQLLSELALPEPRSDRMCNSHLDLLRGRETSLVLGEILRSFPCKVCQDFLRRGVTFPQFRNDLADIEGGFNMPEEEIFSSSKGIGDWQVVLSSRAYRNLQDFEEDPRTRNKLQSKLTALAAGGGKSDTLKFRGEAPRIPLRNMKCSSNTHLLWQIDIAPGPGVNMEQQVIKVWTVGSEKAFETMLDGIKKFQKGLSETRVSRSLEVGPLIRGKRWPQVYEESGNTKDLRPQTALDIRLIDQEFIDTFNKSFTLTQDILHSIIQRDLTAEYPFDLSQKELRIIQHFKTPTLILGRSGTGKTTCLIFKMIAKYVVSCKASPQQPARQVLLTCSEHLAAKLRTYTRRLVTTLSKKAVVPGVQATSGRIDQRTLRDLDYNDFPLVCTWELFLTLLDRTISQLDRKDFHSESPFNLVDFKTFRHKYWPHFPPDVTRGIPPQLVFSEIMGVIKGSNYTCENLEFLQARDYEELSVRIAPNVTSREARTRVFRMFEMYEKLKQQTGNLDTVDWVVCLLRKLRDNPKLRSYLASCVDEFYIDEVQDLRCVDIALLLTLGNDPRTFHFGGDTAQGISQDAVFRFQDVKALFHRYFHRWIAITGQKIMAQPQMFTLDRNYRSHQGILSLASTVMDLLWRSFPDTVDKLEPEVGTLIGPAPILFQACDASILTQCRREGSPDNELLFGAEQVIITRDENGKADLVQMIGHTALILTILQAKGMEFDDVILWNFLSTTPDAVGWRNLQNSMREGSSNFDTVKHAGLCSELKHLYVAITRSRVRFLVIECSEEALQPFIRLMNKISASKVIEVTSPACDDFSDKIKALEPRRSDDPHRWCANGEDMMARALYKEACLCFRRAGQPLKESRATAFLQEIEGEELAARGEQLGSRKKFEESAKAFQDLNSISDAARLLIRLDRLEDAAELWYTKGDFEQAAALFEKALNHERASESWHSHRDYNKAVVCLQNGALFDRLVRYLDSNKALLTDWEILRHRPAIKHLLNKRKIQEEYRRAAIRLLGSVADQERFYLDYEMTDSLVDLYREQHETTKLLNMLIKLDRLEEALRLGSSVAIQDQFLASQLPKIRSVVWVDRIRTHSPEAAKPVVEEGGHTWNNAFDVLHSWDHSGSQEQILGMEDGSVVRQFLCLYTTLNMEKVISATRYDQLPFDLLSHTVKIVRTQQPGSHGIVSETVSLLCGVRHGFDPLQKLTLRTWSPLQETHQTSQDENSLMKAAMQWTTHQVSRAMMRVHELAIELYRKKWPTLCNFFLVTGRCSYRYDGSGCSNAHEHIEPSAYAASLEDLLKITRVLCEMTPLYHQWAMPEEVSMNFLGARGYWVKRLFMALSYISGFEQDSAILKQVSEKIRTDESMRVVASCMEEHLLFKTRSEWSLQCSLGYVLEQLDSAAHLGENVKRGLIRRTRRPVEILYRSVYAAMVLLERVQMHVTSGDPVQYLHALSAYTSGPHGINTLQWNDFEALHCHTSVFEGIALYLLMRMSQSSIAIPRSWLDFQLSDILRRNDLTKPPTFDQRAIFRDALIMLLQFLNNLVYWLEQPKQAAQKISACNRDYPKRLLKPRIGQLFAIILCNLYSLYPPNIIGLRALELSLLNTRYLDHTAGNLTDLRNKLVASYARYHGKDSLIILNVVDVPVHPFTAFQKSNKLGTEKLSKLRNRLSPTKPSNDASTSDEDQLAKEGKAALCIQKRWRRFVPLLKARKLFANTSLGRIITKLVTMAKTADLKVRSILFSLGVDCLAQIGPLGSSISDLKRCALRSLAVTDVKDSEALDSVLEGVGKMEEGLKLHYERLTNDVLNFLTRLGDWQWLEELLKGQLEQMSREERELSRLSEIFNRMAEGSK